MKKIKAYSLSLEVIIFQSLGMVSSPETARLAGAFRYLDKSFDRDELVVLIEHIATIQKLRRDIREKELLAYHLMETSSILLGAQSEQEVLSSILGGIRALGFDRVRLYTFDGQYMYGKAHVGMPNDFTSIERPVTDDPYMQELLKSPYAHVCTRKYGIALPFEEKLDKEGVNEWVCVPLVHRGAVIGALSADNKHSQRPIQGEELGPITLFASHAAIALVNARLFEETKRQAEQLDALRRITLAITSPLEHDSLLHTILTHAAGLLKAKGSGFYKYYPEREELKIIADLNRPLVVGRLVKVGEGVVGRLVQKPQPYKIVENYHTLPERIQDWPDDTVFGALLEVPLEWQGEILGVLFVGDDVGRKFTEQEANLLRSFADQAAISLVHAELAEQEVVKAQQLVDKLPPAAKEITGDLGKTTLPKRLDIIAKHVSEILDAEASCVFLKHSSGCLRLEAAHGHIPGSRVVGREYLICSGPGLGLISHIAYRGKAFRRHGKALQNHWASDGSAPGQLPSGARCSILVVPLKQRVGLEEQLVGLIRVENKRGKDGQPHPTVGFTEGDRRLLSNVAEVAMVAIENDMLVKELREQQDRWARLVASSPNGIIALDGHGFVTGFNDKAREILEYADYELSQKHIEDLYYDAGQAREIGNILRAHNGKITQFPTSMRNKSGDNIPI